MNVDIISLENITKRMEFFEVIKKRRSVRKFTNQKVDAEIIDKALDAALKAPNSSNLQPWEFYWIQNPQIKSQIVTACFNQNAAKTAQEIIFVVSRIDRWNKHRKAVINSFLQKGPLPKLVNDYYNKLIPLAYIRDPFFIKDFLFWLGTTIVGVFRPIPRTSFGRGFENVTKSTALACENLMLALTAQGLGSCPMEGFDDVRIKKILGLNRNCHVVMGIGIGYPAENGIYGEQFRVPKEWVVKKV